MFTFLILTLVFGLIGETLAVPVQVADADRNDETEATINPSPSRPASILLPEVIALMNLTLALINILMTCWIGRRLNP